MHLNNGIAIPVLSMKVYRGRGVTVPPVLKLSTRWQCVVSLMPRLLYPTGKSFQQGGPQQPFWMSWSTQKCPSVARIWTASSSHYTYWATVAQTCTRLHATVCCCSLTLTELGLHCRFKQNCPIYNFTKTYPEGSKLFHVDSLVNRRKDTTDRQTQQTDRHETDRQQTDRHDRQTWQTDRQTWWTDTTDMTDYRQTDRQTWQTTDRNNRQQTDRQQTERRQTTDRQTDRQQTDRHNRHDRLDRQTWQDYW